MRAIPRRQQCKCPTFFLRISNMRERWHDCLLDQDRVHLGSITVVHEVTDEPFSHFPIDCFHFVWICCVHRCINLITERREILSSIDPMKILLTLGLMKKEVFLCTFAKDWEFRFFIFITSWMDEEIGFTISEPLFIYILQCLCRDLMQQIQFSSRLSRLQEITLWYYLITMTYPLSPQRFLDHLPVLATKWESNCWC